MLKYNCTQSINDNWMSDVNDMNINVLYTLANLIYNVILISNGNKFFHFLENIFNNWHIIIV